MAPGRAGATGGARYTGRGPVWGTIKRRGVCAAVPAAGCPGRAGWPGRPIPCPGSPGTRFSVAGCASNSAAGSSLSAVRTSDSIASDVDGKASLSSSAVIWSSITGSEGCAVAVADDRCAGGVAGGAATGGFGGMKMAAGGRATDWGVMKRGAGLGASAGAAGVALATVAADFVSGGAGRTAEGGAMVCRGAAGAACVGCVAGRATEEGWAARWVTAFNTSPGLEMCDRSSLGLNSSAEARDEARLVPGSACSAKYFLTRSASSTSMELECVFFSVTPTLMRASRIILLFTSSSLARSLIRIFCIPPYFLRIVPPVKPSSHPHIAATEGRAGYLCSPGFSSSGTFSFSPAGRSCVVTSASSAGGASSTPSTTSAS
jgi:hypothetical protein